MADEVIDQVDQTIDQPETQLEDTTLPEATDTEGQQTQQTTEEKVDGRRFNPEWSKALKELRELYPDKADMFTKMRDTYARYQALQEVAPKGLDDVRQWKTTLDALGGSEAAAELMQRVADVEQIDSRIEAGDYSVVSDLPESMQKGIYQMLPDMLADLSEKGDPAFTAAVAPHFQAALAGTGLGKVLDNQLSNLSALYSASTDPEVRATLKQLHQELTQTKNWYDEQTQGGKMPNGHAKTASAEVQRLQAELNQRRQADETTFIQGVTDTTNKYVSETFTKESAVYLNQLNLTEAQQQDLSDSFNAKLVDKLAADQAFQKQLGAYKSIKNRTPEQVNTYIRGKIDEYAKPILDGLVTARYGGIRQKKPTATSTTTTTDNGATRVAKAPEQSQWDMAKMEAQGYENTVKKGIFYLQGNRTVQLVRPN